MKCLLLIIGTRPEAIKMAPVALRFQARPHEFRTVLCSTGQHRDMLDQALAPFGLVPDLDLGLMRPQQTLSGLTSQALTALNTVLADVRPDLVLVQGDTTSAMVGALAAYYHRIPVAHVEAGLRTDDLYQPFPEEGNRRLISTLASLHFAPTPAAGRRLWHEGVPDHQLLVTGNTVIDALLYVRDRLAPAAPPATGRRLLVTMHRRESYGQPFEDVCQAIRELVARHDDIEVVFPVHAAPAVREPVNRLLRGQARIVLHEPLGYQEFVQLLASSYMVLTDSGGIQEEAPVLGKPVLVLRDKTERLEAIQAGTSMLVGTDAARIVDAALRLLDDAELYHAMAHAVNPYGDGHAAERIVDALRCYFGLIAARPVPFAPAAIQDLAAGRS